MRLPRPRPEPSPETVAAVTAPAPTAPAVSHRAQPSAVASADDYVVPEPGSAAAAPAPYDDSYDSGPYPPYEPAPPPYAGNGPQQFQIIGRVEDHPGLMWRRAVAERYVAARRAWAERRARRNQTQYYAGPFAPAPDPAPYTAPYTAPYQPQPQVPWAQQTWNGSVPGY